MPTSPPTAAPAGTVLAAEADGVRVATGQGTLVLTVLRLPVANACRYVTFSPVIRCLPDWGRRFDVSRLTLLPPFSPPNTRSPHDASWGST